MRASYIVTAGLITLALNACTTMSPESYEAVKTALAGSPGFKAERIKSCAARVSNDSLQDRRELALLANVSLETMPATVCRRILNAAAAGQLTYDDVAKSKRGQVTPNLVKALQGRR